MTTFSDCVLIRVRVKFSVEFVMNVYFGSVLEKFSSYFLNH